MKLLEIFDTSTKKILVESAGVARPDGIVQVADDAWLMVINNFNGSGKQEIYKFNSQEAVDKAFDEYTNSDPNFKNRYSSNRRTGLLKNFNAMSDNIDEADFNRRAQRSTWLKGITQSRIWGPLLGVLKVAGVSLTVFYSINVAIDEVYEDRDLTPEEKQEQISILYGLLYTELLALFGIILGKTILIKRAIQPIKALVRTIQVGVAAGSGGTLVIPTIITMILSEAAFFAVTYLLTNPTVQRLTAEWLAGTIAGQLIAGFGKSVNGVASALNELTGGLIGSPDLQRWMGLQPGATSEDFEREAYASSEWAKLVFSHILFGGMTESVLVPYIPAEQRERLLAQAFNTSVESIERDTGDNLSPRLDTKGETPTPPKDDRNVAPLGSSPPNISDLTGMGEPSGPATGTGRLSSSRPQGSSPSIRPGEETNALDAIAADRNRLN